MFREIFNDIANAVNKEKNDVSSKLRKELGDLKHSFGAGSRTVNRVHQKSKSILTPKPRRKSSDSALSFMKGNRHKPQRSSFKTPSRSKNNKTNNSHNDEWLEWNWDESPSEGFFDFSESSNRK